MARIGAEEEPGKVGTEESQHVCRLVQSGLEKPWGLVQRSSPPPARARGKKRKF